MSVQHTSRPRRFALPRMEGRMARWYAEQRRSGHQLDSYRAQAARLTRGLPDGARVLEIAPGPGYQAIEIARLGRYPVTGLDISHTFVEIATENARRAGVAVEFRRGDAASLPFDAMTFDLTVCQAAFKNFSDPVSALNEMYRVLRPGGTAVIQDMRREATGTDIRAEVAGMQLTALNALMTRTTLTMLRLRAFPADRFRVLAAASRFGGCRIEPDGMGMEVRLSRPAV